MLYTPKFLLIIVLALLFTLLPINAYEGEDQGLKVESTFRPNNCDEHRKSQSGDELEMHYTGTIDASSPTGTRMAPTTSDGTATRSRRSTVTHQS